MQGSLRANYNNIYTYSFSNFHKKQSSNFIFIDILSRDGAAVMSTYYSCRAPTGSLSLQGAMDLAWPGYRLESMASGAQCVFQVLRNRCTPSGSEAIRPLCVSLSAPAEVKDTWKLDRPTGLRH